MTLLNEDCIQHIHLVWFIFLIFLKIKVISHCIDQIYSLITTLVHLVSSNYSYLLYILTSVELFHQYPTDVCLSTKGNKDTSRGTQVLKSPKSIHKMRMSSCRKLLGVQLFQVLNCSIFIGVHVQCQESEWSCICVLGVMYMCVRASCTCTSVF